MILPIGYSKSKETETDVFFKLPDYLGSEGLRIAVEVVD